MASPVDAGRATTDITTASDPWTVNLPASIASGDLLVLSGRNGNQQTLGTNTGWTTMLDTIADASNDRTFVLLRVADGTEGATMSLDFAGTCKGAADVRRITGAPTSGTILELTATANVDSNQDPPSQSVTGGPEDVLAIVFGSLDGETQTFTEPSGYQNIQNANSGTGAAADTNVRIGVATLGITNTSSVDPGAFTNAAAATASGGTVVTMVVHPSAGAFEINAVAGSYTITGAAATLLAASLLSADPDSYAINGIAATLTVGRVLSADPGVYAINGAAATLLADSVLSADPGSYAINGADAALTAGYVLSADPGAYAINGAAAELVYATAGAFSINAEPGVYTVTGANATTVAGRVLSADPGAYVVTGAAATLTAGRVLSADPGSYAVTGAAATLLAGRALTAVPGVYMISGAAATLVSSGVLTGPGTVIGGDTGRNRVLGGDRATAYASSGDRRSDP